MQPALSALLLVASLPALGAAQDTTAVARLRGYVVDAETHEPISGVRVEVAGSGRSVLTDSAGAFVLDRLPLGRLTVRASRIGFAPVERRDVPLTGDAILTLLMETQAIVLEGVSVEVNGRLPRIIAQLDRRRNGWGVSSAVYNQDDLHYRGMTDLRHFVLSHSRFVPGPCPGGRGYGCLNLRGRPASPRVIVDEQGRTLDFLQSIDPYHVARVEIFQGGRHIRVYTTQFLEFYASRGLPLPGLDIVH